MFHVNKKEQHLFKLFLGLERLLLVLVASSNREGGGMDITLALNVGEVLGEKDNEAGSIDSEKKSSTVTLGKHRMQKSESCVTGSVHERRGQ